VTNRTEFSWAQVLSAKKTAPAEPSLQDPLPTEPASVESPAPVITPVAPAQPQALDDEAPDALQVAAALSNHAEQKDSMTDCPQTLAPAAKPSAKRAHSAGQASDKKRWRWARERVIQALYQQILNSTPVDVLDAQFMEDVFMLKVDLELFRRLVRGVSANEKALDAAFTPLLDRPLAELDPIEQAILRMGAFELIHTPEIPRAVAINEAVEMAKLYGASESHKYINGVLDKLADRVRLAEPRRPA